MRKRFLLRLTASLAFLGISGAAHATSVDLTFVGAYVLGGGVSGLGTNTVNLDLGSTATLTLDIQFDVDSDGLSGGFLSLLYDTDLDDELDVRSVSELSWSNAKGTRTLGQITSGILGSQESTLSAEGNLLTFEGVSLGNGPANTTLTFARVVFTTDSSRIQNDGDDIFSGIFNPGIDFMVSNSGQDISGLVSFGNAGVNLVPEPGTVSLLALGIGSLAMAQRHRGRK